MNTEQLARETWLKLEACTTPQEEQDAIQAAIEKATEEITKDRDLWKRQSAFESEHREKYRQRLIDQAAHASDESADAKRLDWAEANVFRFVDLLKTLMPTVGASVNIREAIDIWRGIAAAIQEENQ